MSFFKKKSLKFTFLSLYFLIHIHSLGLSAYFLVGGITRDISPKAILMKSGDGCLLFGEGRRAYHGIPKVIQGSCPTHLSVSPSDSDDNWKSFGEFMESTRINVNLRQVSLPCNPIKT